MHVLRVAKEMYRIRRTRGNCLKREKRVVKMYPVSVFTLQVTF